MVDKYIELQRANKDNAWLEDGAKWKERQTRKRTYEVLEQINETKATVSSDSEVTGFRDPRPALARLRAMMDSFPRSVPTPLLATAPEEPGSSRRSPAPALADGVGTGPILPTTELRVLDILGRTETSNRANRREATTASTATNSVLETLSDENPSTTAVVGMVRGALDALARSQRETEDLMLQLEAELLGADENGLLQGEVLVPEEDT